MMQGSPPSDLGYCRGTHADKTGIFQNQLKTKTNSNVKVKPPRRRGNSSDIKERMSQLEQAMTKTKFVNTDLKLNKGDPNYGCPEEGTKTAARGKKAHTHVHKEILELCELIYTNGFEHSDPDAPESAAPMVIMLFGDLFRIYTRISDKVVGILLRAKKYGLVYFEPEILFQGQDEETPVVLLKPMQEVYRLYNGNNKSFAP